MLDKSHTYILFPFIRKSASVHSNLTMDVVADDDSDDAKSINPSSLWL